MVNPHEQWGFTIMKPTIPGWDKTNKNQDMNGILAWGKARALPDKSISLFGFTWDIPTLTMVNTNGNEHLQMEYKRIVTCGKQKLLR